MVETPAIAVDPVRIEGPITLPAATVGAESALGEVRGSGEVRLAMSEPKRVMVNLSPTTNAPVPSFRQIRPWQL